jgi:hypothetical protein
MSLEGYFIGRKEFRVVKQLAGRRYFGVEVATKRTVHISVLDSPKYTHEQFREMFSYEIEGVARFRTVAGFYKHASSAAVLVEDLPAGTPLLALGGLDDAQRLEIAIALAATIQRATRLNVGLHGIQPELTYVELAPPLSVTLMPRSWAFLGMRAPGKYLDSGESSFVDPTPFYLDPTTLTEPTPTANVYLFGLVIAWLYTGKHAFSIATKRHRDDWAYAMREDSRDPFTGPPAIDRMLDRMLVLDPAQRMSIDEIVHELHALAR